MGLDINGVRFLFYCKKLGVDFTRTATIGRQNLYLNKRDFMRVVGSFGKLVDAEKINSIFDQTNGYAENLLTYLGAKEVHSFDKSGYEGATHLHDMNQQLPQIYKQRYTTVLDGGSLEHIFNFSVAIKNCMEMTSVGGHFLAITPANNFLGHGFYQFSPEVFFSVFTYENGFNLQCVIAFEDNPNARWYSVKSPSEVRGRVTMTNKVPLYLLIVARKLTPAVVFESTPQQSDYLPIWFNKSTLLNGHINNSPPSIANKNAFLHLVKSGVPKPVKRLIRNLIMIVSRGSRAGFDPRFFNKMDPTADI